MYAGRVRSRRSRAAVWCRPGAKPAESRGQAPMPRPQCRAHRAGTSTRCRASFLGRPSILQVFLSSLTVPFLFGAARGLAGDERLAGELDLLVVARRRDETSRGDEAAT